MFKTFVSKKNLSAFTLVELLVVMAIIGSLVAISVVAITQAFKSARDSGRLQDLHNVQLKLISFQGQYNRFPSSSANEIQISADGKQIILYNGNSEYDTITISQAGLNPGIVKDANGFCVANKATADEWFIMYQTGTSQRPQEYALQACLEIGASSNLGNLDLNK